MDAEPRVVVDTNVLVSFLLRRGSTPWRAVRHAFEYGELLMSTASYAELAEVLGRAKFDRYVSLAVREAFLTTLPEFVSWVEVDQRLHVCPDPTDDKFVELAVSGGARVLVTGDRQLLGLSSVCGVDILSPTGYLRTVGV